MPLESRPVKPPEVLLFDLGGVLLESVGFERLSELLPAPLDTAELKARWLRSPAARDFERGGSTPREFADRLVAEWRLRCTAAQLLEEYRDWVRGFYPGALELLARLRPRYRVACLSNSNALHWDKFGGFTRHFEPALASHRMGALKPDEECFAQAVRACAVPAAAIAFFDDAAPNVAAARRLGLRAHRVDGPQAVLDVLAREGWPA